MIHLIIIWIVSHIEVHHSCTCVLASLIACFGLSCASSFFKRKYCNKDCNRQGAPNGTSFKLWEKPYEKNQNHINLEKEEKRMASLLRYQSWLTSWNLLLPRICLTEVKDYILNGHWRITDGVHAQEMDIYISVDDTDQAFYKWLLLLKSDVIIKSLKPDIVVKFLKSDMVAEFLMSDTWFNTKLSSSKHHSRSRTASCSIFHFIFRVVLMQRQLTLPKTAWKFLFSVHVFLGWILTKFMGWYTAMLH